MLSSTSQAPSKKHCPFKLLMMSSSNPVAEDKTCQGKGLACRLLPLPSASRHVRHQTRFILAKMAPMGPSQALQDAGQGG